MTRLQNTNPSESGAITMSQTQSFLPNHGKAALGSTNRTGLV